MRLTKIRPPAVQGAFFVIDHIDHIAKVAGVDHVGLGSDFDGVSGAMPAGMNSAADLPKITRALLDRGYNANDIRKILVAIYCVSSAMWKKSAANFRLSPRLHHRVSKPLRHYSTISKKGVTQCAHPH